MNLNRLVREVLSEAAVELLDTLAAHALVSAPADFTGMFYLPVEQENWNPTLQLVREIFDAEITITHEPNWLNFRVLQSFGVRDGQLAYQFTPVFADAISQRPGAAAG